MNYDYQKLIDSFVACVRRRKKSTSLDSCLDYFFNKSLGCFFIKKL